MLEWTDQILGTVIGLHSSRNDYEISISIQQAGHLLQALKWRREARQGTYHDRKIFRIAPSGFERRKLLLGDWFVRERRLNGELPSYLQARIVEMYELSAVVLE